MRHQSRWASGLIVGLLASCGSSSLALYATTTSGGGRGTTSGSGSSSSGGAVAGGSGSGSAGSGASSGGSAVGASGNSGTSGSSSGGGSSGVTGISFNGNFSDAVSDDNLQGVQVCLLSSPSTCNTTDVNGEVTLSGLQPSNDGISATFGGYVTGVWPFTPVGDLSGWYLTVRTVTRLTKLASEVGVTFGSGAGGIVFAVNDVNGNVLSGASISVNTAGTVAYFDENGDLSTTLTATTSYGGGFVFGVPQGTTQVNFTAPQLTCTRNSAEGWPGTGETAAVPIFNGELTRAAAMCQ